MPRQILPHLLFQSRSLYRSILRELPPRLSSSHTILSDPSSIQRHVRRAFTEPFNRRAEDAADNGDYAQVAAGDSSREPRTHDIDHHINRRLQEGERYLEYVRAQRHYLTLLERYNPGVNMGEEERLRLTARRVGMELPDTDS